MKKNLYTLLLATTILLFIMTSFAFAEGEWSGDGTDIWNTNDGNVGIGTSTPSERLEISDRTSSNSVNLSLDGATGSAGDPVSHIIAKNTVSGIVTQEEATYIKTVSDSAGRRKYNIIFGTGKNGLPSDQMVIDYKGNVGIGTINPSHKLTVNSGTLNFVTNFISSDDKASILLQDDDTLNYINTQNGYLSLGGNSALSSGNLNINTSSGNVGIGTTSPQSKLAVNGTITTKEVKVTETGWSDFVFEDSYNLPSLNHVESFIKENKHLPDIPSAKEVEEEGLSMAEMMKKQMQKIEELTLYVIELKKENENQSEEIAALRNELTKKNN